MLAAVSTPAVRGAAARCGPAARRGPAPVAAAPRRQSGPAGFVAQDNSGKSNIFAVEPKTLYTSSPRADAAAREGLGGSQGLAIAGAVLALVALATLAVGGGGGAPQVDGPSESLTAIAARVQASL